MYNWALFSIPILCFKMKELLLEGVAYINREEKKNQNTTLMAYCDHCSIS